MTVNPRTTLRSGRAALVGLLLVLALAVATALAYEAYHAASSHRAVAAGVLQDYVEMATQQYAGSAAKWIDSAVQQALRAASTPQGLIGPPPTGSKPTALLLDPVVGYFEVVLADKRVLSTSVDLPALVVQRLVDAGRECASSGMPRSAAGLVIADGHGERRVFGFAVRHDPERGDVLAGVETTEKAVASLFRMLLDRQQLLPRTLMREATNAQVLTVQVAPAFGPPVFRSSASQSEFTAVEPLGPRHAGLVVTGFLRPEAAGRLVVGGLPRSRLPLVIGLLAVTMLLVVTALLQLHREYELARLRTEFVSCVSHELRTPLAQIRLFSETLLLGRVRSDHERQRGLEIIDQEARRLTHLVENVLLFSRSERRMSRIAPSVAPLAPAVRRVVEAFAPLARARGVHVVAAVEHDAIAACHDPAAVQQILLNLLDNAVKYGPEGQRVVVGLARAGDRVRLWVEDQGPGVPPADRALIWQPFCRSHRERASSIAGTGIGLAIVRELATLHAGSAWMEPVETGGARFVVELPGASTPEEAVLDVEPEVVPSTAGGLS